jgi:hypothetical protein
MLRERCWPAALRGRKGRPGPVARTWKAAVEGVGMLGVVVVVLDWAVGRAMAVEEKRRMEVVESFILRLC